VHPLSAPLVKLNVNTGGTAPAGSPLAAELVPPGTA
jgi:hypothetical protein